MEKPTECNVRILKVFVEGIIADRDILKRLQKELVREHCRNCKNQKDYYGKCKCNVQVMLNLIIEALE